MPRKTRRSGLSRKRRASSAGIFMRGFSLWMDAGQMMLGAGEVINHRINMLAKSARGETPYDIAEITRMWQEKFAAGIGLAFALNRSGFGAMPILFASPKGAADATAVLDAQLEHLAAALKPYARAVKANRRRLRGKK
ncbi:MAG TPA: hypothetical protein VEF76_05030 [Patescibacteria group bacterium]|nr:hypothetical protein [Patescibacteria group bacterium]